MNLSHLLAHLPGAQVSTTADTAITGVSYDSRQVQPGHLFVAIKGYHVDGHHYIAQALASGARAIIVDQRHYQPTDALQSALAQAQALLIIVPDSRLTLSPLAAAWYQFPAQQLRVVGITGTKGKSTTTALVSCALECGGLTTGMLTTVDFKVGPRQWPNTTRQSTPEAPEVQALLREMADADCAYAVLEATSHALSPTWKRLADCAFDIAVFTNITHEHLDYHGSFEQYRSDKAQLFAMLGQSAQKSQHTPYAIVNADDPNHRFFLDAAPAHAQRLTYGLHPNADIRATIEAASPAGTRFHVQSPWSHGTVQIQLPGAFNVANALAAVSVALTQGIALDQVAQALATVTGIRGRMQRIDQGQPFGLIIDYAHNPDSFTQVLSMLRPITAGRIIIVFGSAGERDRAKRPLQGAIAAQYCDLLILTDEDPRREDRESILADIAAGAEQAGKQRGSGYLAIPDRSEAITTALSIAEAGDLVLLLGKGHETSIEYADGKHPWDEVATAQAALRGLGYHGR
ncbi:MAG: UDP-N-acetylmuramoyl-L-alanyl-D-glutamate--2,6-diaminopimelate ligase [Chloroflexaceae bacterium]|nr:UDP-N-acetylmuramoyl-L-alanyl-D-glutamate--2,6-diaminopimelate ligase [Chloroflexaceae bacterium]